MELTQIIIASLLIIIAFYIGIKIGNLQVEKQLDEKVKKAREESVNKSRAVLQGQFSEQLAPFMPDFPFNPSDCRFIGKPIDLLVFKGMGEKDISEVVFVEVKTGNSKLSSQEKKLKEAIENKKVSWYEYRK